MQVNQLHDAWIASGQKVSDLNAKLNAAVMDDSFNAEEFAELKAKRDNEATRRDALKDQLDEARANEVKSMKTPKSKLSGDNDPKDEFVSDFKNMMSGKFNAIKETNVEDNSKGNGGLIVPDDQQTAIRELLRQQANLQTLVTTETVSTNKGSRIIDENEDMVVMGNISEGETIPDLDDPKLHQINYVIDDYAGIFTATNDLLDDSPENVESWLQGKISKYVGFSRSRQILNLMPKATKKVTLNTFNDIKHMINTGIDPELMPGAILVTNQSGYDELSNLTDAIGRPLLQPDPANPDFDKLGKYRIVWYSDAIIPDVAADTHPLYYGNFKQFATVFDRESTNLLATNIGGGAFNTNTTKIRVIDRYDVQSVDNDAVVVGSFKKLTSPTIPAPAQA